MRRVSKQRAALMAEAGPWREAFKARIGKCEVCQKLRDPDYLACHEVCRGPWRRKALMAPFALLVVCRYADFQKQRDCHAEIQDWKEVKQLALLYLVDQSRYDL